MKAMVVQEPAPIASSPLQLREVPLPEPGEGEVRVRVSCCAICRTDLHVIEGELPRQRMPVIPGHQVVGVVDRVGPGCRDARGRKPRRHRLAAAHLRRLCVLHDRPREPVRVAAIHGLSRRRRLCRVCRGSRGLRLRDPRGLQRRRCGPPALRRDHRLSGLDAEPAPAGRHAGDLRLRLLAHVVIQIALHRGCRVLVVTRGEKHRRLALEMGAEWAGETIDGIPALADSAIIFAPAGELVPSALQILKKGGTLALAGIYMTDDPRPRLRDAPVLREERPLRHRQHPRRRPGPARRGGPDPDPPAHHDVSAGRRQPGPPGPQGRPAERDGRARGGWMSPRASYQNRQPNLPVHIGGCRSGMRLDPPRPFRHTFAPWSYPRFIPQTLFEYGLVESGIDMAWRLH